MCHSYHEKYMKLAIQHAKNVEIDIPVCAIVVKNDEIISVQVNKREKNNSVISHAEILALEEASKKLNSWRLADCDMYVTLEPCPMCAWAILNSRIKNLYFGSYDIKYGALGSALDLRKYSSYITNAYGGFLEDENNKLLKEYFLKMRENNFEKDIR